MSNAATQQTFTGPYSEELAELAELLDWLWEEHGVAFVKAGDDQVYAFGGNGSIIVCDQSKWDGLIEFITPDGAITIKPDESGNPVVTAAKADATEEEVRNFIKRGAQQIRDYYENRYWSTPR